MVAPAYAETRSALAKSIGLGQLRTAQVVEAAPEPVEEAPSTKRKAPARPKAERTRKKASKKDSASVEAPESVQEAA